jgi:hypothetical protein
MAQSAAQTIPKEKFLLIATNLLHRQFMVAPRTEAKRVFRELADGRVVPITTVRMEDNSTVAFRLELDHSEFDGKLNFGAFRASLAALINKLSRSLEEKREVTVFNMQHRDQSVLFGVTGVTVEQAKPNVLVLGADTSGPPGNVLLRLIYLDHRQFAASGAGGGAAPGQTSA